MSIRDTLSSLEVMVHEPAASAPPRSLLERRLSGPVADYESESAFQQHPQEIGKALF